ncbi:MAG: hypothetical protein B7O98_08260 [Zestosphaera tikiterensis]|uniref:CopG family transcriptional regulator n=1 Tax=Zestosphaera tikiterensis TaxID=1973259 RepID=A0A2R7Y2S9_9CREN|nr:MAG: hypothetical protein B7O98_08260 [Zestosphaera tikiterensis]
MTIENWVTAVSTTISFRIPKKLKERMALLKDRVNWSEELRRFIEQRIKELEQLSVFEKIDRILEKLPEAPKGAVVSYLREIRDRH